MADKAVVKVSVIIPAYKRPELLAEALESVLCQRMRDFEVIVVDDDPSGSSRDIVEASQDPRLVYVCHPNNRGASAARNTGLGVARGEFIAFLDDDDIWHPDFLLKMTAVMAGLPPIVGVLHCAVELVAGNGACTIVRPRPSDRGDVREAMLRGEKSGGIVALVRREVFAHCGGFDESLPSAQDWDMWIRASQHFHFDHIPDVLAAVRVCGERISADPLRAIASRERILEKYAAEFARCPQARRIHEKRLGKLNAVIGRWGLAWRWFARAAAGHGEEWVKTGLWILLERPFIPGPMASAQASRYLMGAVLAAFVVGVYSQFHAFMSPYVINDDVCQHIWWMRVFREPGLFQNDLLAQYARSLQNLGILGLYRTVACFLDPVEFARFLPLFLFPVTVWALYRLVFTWTKDAYTALFTCMVFMVTPIYMQHMTGGHAHAFGYMFLLLFLSFFAMGKYRAAALMMISSAFFFPVVFILAAGFWLGVLLRERSWRNGRRVQATVLAGVLLGILVLAVKFFVLSDPLVGSPLSREAVASMPELTAAGRWAVWPVAPVWQACLMFFEQGVFIFKAGYRLFYFPEVKEFLLGGHVLSGFLALLAGFWWWRRRKDVPFFPLALLAAVSVLLYLVASLVVLKLYAPDRYVAYSVTVIALVFLAIPAGMALSSWPEARGRRYGQAGALAAVLLLGAPLVRDAGLKDFARHQSLYNFLAALPQDALIAAFPDTADGIPVFARRRVFINEELSVALFDRYWEAVKVRTFDLLGAYYAPDAGTVASFIRRNGITHLVIERRHYAPEFLGGKIYFEPFGSWVRAHLSPGQSFYLEGMPDKDCLFLSGDVCVVDAAILRQAGGL